MARDDTSDEPVGVAAALAEHVVATSEQEPPEETLARLFGDPDEAELATGLEMVAELFGQRDAPEPGADPGRGDASGGVADVLDPDEETRHEIHLDDSVECAHCVDGALFVAELVDRDPVTVRSLDPVSGEPVTFEVAEGGGTVSPDGALVSMGMASTAVESEDMVAFGVAVAAGERDPGEYVDDPLDVYCRNFNAFVGRETYERWAADADAVSVAVPAPVFAATIRDVVSSPAFE